MNSSRPRVNHIAPGVAVPGPPDHTVLPAHSTKMAGALRAQGVGVELLSLPERRHVDTVLALSRPGRFRVPELQGRIAAFVRARTGR